MKYNPTTKHLNLSEPYSCGVLQSVPQTQLETVILQPGENFTVADSFCLDPEGEYEIRIGGVDLTEPIRINEVGVLKILLSCSSITLPTFPFPLSINASNSSCSNQEIFAHYCCYKNISWGALAGSFNSANEFLLGICHLGFIGKF